MSHLRFPRLARLRRLSVVCAVSIVTATPAAYAELIAYEAFDYTDVGENLSGKDGGSGFSSSWAGRVRISPSTGFIGEYQVADGSLSYLTLQTDGNRVSTPALSNDRWSALGRLFDTPISRDETTTKYLSALLRPEGRVGQGTAIGVFGIALFQGGQDVFMGKPGASAYGEYVIEDFGTGSHQFSSGVPAVSGNTALVVVKAELQPGMDRFTLYVNPIPGLPEPVTAPVKNDIDVRDVKGIALTSGGAFSVDEIRWGDTFADVTPSPPVSVVELIGRGEQWSFFPGRTEPSPFPEIAWTTQHFDDSTWETGLDGFGYGPDTETRGVVTVLDDMKDNYATVYLRHSFDVENPEVVSDLMLQADFDDGFIAYINGVEVVRSAYRRPGTPEPFDRRISSRRGSGVGNFLIELDSFPELLRSGEDNVLAIQGINRRSSDSDFVLSQLSLSAPVPMLQAGDADQDRDFDQLDLVQVQIAAKYLTGQPATWGEGDWNGAPGGSPGTPPAGEGLFNQLDIVAAQQAGLYLTGPYAAVLPKGQRGDDQTSIIYDAGTGEVAVDAPAGTELTSINIDSTAGIFTGEAAQNLGGSFDNDADTNIFKATFGSSFGSLSFGNLAQTGLGEQFLLNDLTVVGSLAGGGALGDVDLVYVPEPTGAVLASLALVVLTFLLGRRGANVSRRSTYEPQCARPRLGSMRFAMNYGRIALLCAFCAISGTAPAYAELIAYEGFDYGDTGQPLRGKSGGIGLAGEWMKIQNQFGGEAFLNYTVAEGSLSFGGIRTTGKRLHTDQVSPWSLIGRADHKVAFLPDVVRRRLACLAAISTRRRV